MAGVEVNVRDQIVAFKRALAPNRERLKRAYAEVKDHVSRSADRILSDVAGGRPVVPELDYRDIRDGKVSDAARQSIRNSGCAVIRGVFPAASASGWFAELGEDLETNRYQEREVEKRSLDKYFSSLKAGTPQIFNVYWSRPQVMARQDAKLAETRAFLDRLWKYDGMFDPDRQCTYADRVRRRQPGDKTLGISPHMDAGTVERWIDPGYQKVYEHIFAGDWRGHDAFDARHRLDTREIPSPAVCSMFRTYQGWTALTRQGPETALFVSSPSPRALPTCSCAHSRTTWTREICAGRRQGVRSASASSGTLSSSPRWSQSLRSCPAIRCSGTPTSVMPSATNTRAANTPASSTSDPRPTARRIAPTCRNSGRPFSRVDRLRTSPPWTSKSTSRGVRRWRI